MISEEYSDKAIVTQQPFEDIGAVTDNIQRLPDEMVVVAKVTETPLSSGIRTDDVLFPLRTNPSVRPRAARDFLNAIRSQPFTYITAEQRVLRNMTLVDMSYGVRNRKHYIFNLSLRQIRIGTSQIVDLPPERIRPPKLKPTDDAGDQTGSTDPQAPMFSSAAADAGLGSIFAF